MSLYEVTFIFRQDITMSEVNNIIDGLSKIIVDSTGKVLKREYWGLLELAYSIKKNKKGHYIMLVVEASGRTVQELHKRAKLSEDIIRVLAIKIEAFEGQDSIMMRSKDGEVPSYA